MTFQTGANLTLQYTHRFFDDYRRLSDPIAEKTSQVRDLVRSHGVYYPSLHTRRVERNGDARFRFMNVDDQYRIVVAVEGPVVLFMRVGNHDETLKWGERASLAEFRERLLDDPTRPSERRRHDAQAAVPVLFEQDISLPQLVARADDVSDLISGDLFGALEGYRDGSMEDWMVFLSPLQTRAVSHAMDGPGRVTGGPGTGKTVVALHRAARLAQAVKDPYAVVLLTSFVRTIPDVLKGLYARLSPSTVHRIEARGIHSLAASVLKNRGISVTANPEAARERFDRALERNADEAWMLQRHGFSPGYLWDEVRRVIAGRGLESQEQYMTVRRHGRRMAMGDGDRGAVWRVYETYMSLCGEAKPRIVDHETMLNLAYRSLLERPTNDRYAAIVVDEAQDITETGVRFLLAMLEGGDRGRLLLVGDGGQRIYPGGYRLADLGLDVRGRSHVLRLCYRSTDEIMAAVGGLGRWLSLEEYGDDGLGEVDVTTVRTGRKPELRAFGTPDDELDWLVSSLDPDDEDLDATAVLAPTNTKVDLLASAVEARGIGVVRLIDYQGESRPGVKVGTYSRAKGLEFKRVVLPGLDTSVPWGSQGDIDSILLQGGQLYVAMSRARDVLDLSHAGEPSPFLDPLVAHVEAIQIDPPDDLQSAPPGK